MNELTQLHCSPVKADTPRLTDSEVNQLRVKVPGWQTHVKDGELRLEKTFTFKDFTQAVAFTDRIALAVALVVLVPADEWRRSEAFYRVALADSAGAFAVPSVAPGGYQAYAFDEAVPSGALLDPDTQDAAVGLPALEVLHRPHQKQLLLLRVPIAAYSFEHRGPVLQRVGEDPHARLRQGYELVMEEHDRILSHFGVH